MQDEPTSFSTLPPRAENVLAQTFGRTVRLEFDEVLKQWNRNYVLRCAVASDGASVPSLPRSPCAWTISIGERLRVLFRRQPATAPLTLLLPSYAPMTLSSISDGTFRTRSSKTGPGPATLPCARRCSRSSASFLPSSKTRDIS